MCIYIRERHSETCGLKINASKTNVMSVNGTGSVYIGPNTEIKRVEKFKYLGSYVCEGDPSSCEVRTRMAIAKSTMSRMNNVWRSSKIGLNLKKRLVKSLVWSVALYGCESWTLRLVDERMIESTEMWCWRRMLGIRWTDKRTNEWVREREGDKSEK